MCQQVPGLPMASLAGGSGRVFLRRGGVSQSPWAEGMVRRGLAVGTMTRGQCPKLGKLVGRRAGPAGLLECVTTYAGTTCLECW